ncbi:hypothetical protein [Ktedonobacter racemifer]|uniref:Uncharacterized protein n=1 Tax=Ktedonobacter racemifer DSM 44963 TaxID=485913 RepID=D6TW16_KTERA|nr:hypothetical protein [Ktedonobacter racemifer]EFH84399.1 hypothetical protein Krac_5431 [Ktedonobacter racemifer DSM 44963]
MQDHAIPRAAMIGAASGVLVMAFFSTGWASLAVGALNGWGNAFLSPLVWLTGIIQLIAGIYLLIAARQFPVATAEQQAQGRNMGKWYGITFGLEGVFIGVASAICNVIGHTEILIPIIALIVGVHFYPFALIFNRHIDYWLASWTCLVALVALFAVPATPITSGGMTIDMQWLVCGLGTAIATWIYSVYGFREGMRMLRFNKQRQVEVTLPS